MNALRFDELRFAARRLRKDLGSTIASIAALACAIGAAVATWSLLSAVLLNPLPVAEPDRLFQVETPLPPNFGGTATGHSYAVVESIRNSGTFAGIAAGGSGFGRALLVTEQGLAPQRRQVHFAAHDFFATLGIAAARGRAFTTDDDRRGAPPVAMLTDHYWRRVFNGDTDVLGRRVTVAGTLVTIVGILPHGFRGVHLSEAPDLYLPLHVASDIDSLAPGNADVFSPGFSWIRVLGRLRPGDTTAAAVARLNTLNCMCSNSGREVTHGENGGLVLTSVDIAAVPESARPGMQQFTTLLSITVGLLLLVSCFTVGMLLLVRAEDRRDELAVRLALGATRARLAAGLAVDAAILIVAGAALAVPVALWPFYGVRAFELPGGIAIERLELTLDPGVWLAVTAVTFAAASAIALLAGSVGVGIAARSPVQTRAFTTPRVTRRAPRTVLVAGQVAITLVLVTGAGLFGRSLLEALTLNSGVATDRIVTGSLDLWQYGYTPERAAAFVDELLERLRQNDVVAAVATVRSEGIVERRVRLMSDDGEWRELPSSLRYLSVDDAYFSALGLPILSGRSVARFDTAGSPPVAVVSESLARFVAGDGNPLGRRIVNWPTWQEPPVYLEIVGVVPDLITNVNATEPLIAYTSIAQRDPAAGANLVLRTTTDPRAAMREMMATVRALDARVTVESMMTLDEQIGRQMSPQRFGIYVLGALGGIALLLTVLGTYVVAESMVVRRRRELGIRAALGARSAQLRSLVLRDTARLVGIGLVAGLALAFAGARLIRSLLYQVQPLDPLVLVTTAAGIFGLALLVSLRPALEASHVDLTRSLREE